MLQKALTSAQYIQLYKCVFLNVCIKIQKFTKLLFKLHKSMIFAVLEIIRISCSFNNDKLSMTSSLKIYSKFVLSNWNFPGQMQKLAHQKMADLRLLFQAVCSFANCI